MNDDSEKIENEDLDPVRSKAPQVPADPYLTDRTSNGVDVELVPDEEGALPDLQEKIKRLKAERTACDRERKEYLDGWQRAKADAINYKKDEQRRFEELARYATGDLLLELIGVLDNFDLALGAGAPPEADPVRSQTPLASADVSAHRTSNGVEKGIVLIRGQLENVLRKQGVEAMEGTVGEQFNPELHEAIGEEESAAPAGAVARILQKGYRLRGRIIRPARVKLSKGREN